MTHVDDATLFAALRSADPDAVDAALANGGDPDGPRDRYGRTALHVAVRTGRHTCIARLIARGADPFVSDPRGESALDAALDEGDATLFDAMPSAGRSLPPLKLARRLNVAVRWPKLASWILQPGDAPLTDATSSERAIAEDWEDDALPEPVTASLLHALVDAHNWDSGNELVVRVVAHPLCTPLTARLAYDRAELASYDPSEPVPAWQRADVRWQADLFVVLHTRFAAAIDEPR
ncbi:ankyrin repeat domain-containing protein [Sandaracinus amylolyticus]|uniref:ankyrin repeat domain-containing protein n=1 Tax=Sandaracinus amylolyticus TaxID=927083 RepID=UPI001F455BC9|nr:ankyrin repeat domain-containing protein [Sandaracinus amylolyticus]UJR81521.1 Hypothetical protein I5071_35810 [Sandaracinus amylolyticus]